MKKVLTLLVVLAIGLSIVACAGPATDPNVTQSTTPTTIASATDPSVTQSTTPATSALTTAPITEPTTVPNASYAGKKLQILGVDDYNYANNGFDAFGKDNFLWMTNAAMVEWAELNGVTLEFKGRYTQSVAKAMVNGGEVDIIIAPNAFPQTADLKIGSALSDVEYKKLADVCGQKYLDAVSLRNQSYGVALPWSSIIMCCYNRSMFEDYDLKTPREYFLEGNWTWETFLECMRKTTRDTDGDGANDSYGIGSDFDSLVNSWKTDSDGKMLSVIDEQWMRDFIQLKYDAYTEHLVYQYQIPKPDILLNAVTPIYAMQLYSCEVYNMEKVFQTSLAKYNMEFVPLPEWKGKDGLTMPASTIVYDIAGLAASCDEREAALDMLAYVLQCGMKYMSDFSMGLVPCNYPGVQGTCDKSAQWKNAFAKVCEERVEAYKKLPTDDVEYLKAINAYVYSQSMRASGTYTEIVPLTGYSEIVNMPPASSISAIKEKYQAALDKYNDRYTKK